MSKQPKGEWPLPGQNNRYLAQAELPCNMPHAPKERWSFELGHDPVDAAICADVDDDGEMEILYGAFPLICTTLTGKEKWRASCGAVRAIADIDADGRTEILVGGTWTNVGGWPWIRGGGTGQETFVTATPGGDPAILRGNDGRLLWQRTGPGLIYDVSANCQVAKLIPTIKGLQVACVSEEFAGNAKIGQVWSFAEGCDNAKLVWERRFAEWEHSGSMVGRFDGDTICLMSPTWGGITVLNAQDGSDMMRLFWEEAPGKSGLRNYGPLFVTQLADPDKTEIVILAHAISLHIDVIAPWRGEPGTHAAKENPWPAPAVPYGDLASYPDGPNLWRRFFGTIWPQDDYILHFPNRPVADVDGDGKKEILAIIGREQWELKVYDGMTGVEKFSLAGIGPQATVWDFDGDGISEIAVMQSGALVIGSLCDGKWNERLRLPGYSLPRTAKAVSGELPGDTFHVEQQPIALTSRNTRSWVATSTNASYRATNLALVTCEPGGEFTVTYRTLATGRSKILAAAEDRLVTATPDGHVHIISRDSKTHTSWAGGLPFVSRPAVADIDGDGINEVVVCKGGGRVAALRATHGSTVPKLVWEVEGRGLMTSYPAPIATPLIADVGGDVNGNGKKAILVVKRGATLLDHLGETIWTSDIAAWRTTFGDFNGSGRQDVYLAAWQTLPGSIGTTTQSFALDGRTGKTLWHNDGSGKLLWHHQLGPMHRQATVADVNGDGCEEILFVALDRLVELSGKDGSYLLDPITANEIWKQSPDEDGQWTAWGAQIPVDLNGDGKLEILLAASWGQWGAWTLDRKLLWTFNPDRAQLAQRFPGIADVDGDGKLEIGVIHDGGFFRCYDATNGKLKWELTGIQQTTDVVTADIDGDGRPEFLAGLAAFKPIDQTRGRVVWEVDVPAAHSPVVADVDGDGLCEIVLGCTDGIVRVFK